MDTNEISKALGNYDESGFEFTKELLDGDPTAAVNFDRIQKHPQAGYIIFEYLLCEQSQHVTPYTSHPNRYWNKNRMKFLSLWRTVLAFDATLILVNYAKKGTPHADKVKTILVTEVTCHGLSGEEQEWTRSEFQEWFRNLNRESLAGPQTLLEEISALSSLETLQNITIPFGKHKGMTLGQIDHTDRQHLRWLAEKDFLESPSAKAYLEKTQAANAE